MVPLERLHGDLHVYEIVAIPPQPTHTKHNQFFPRVSERSKIKEWRSEEERVSARKRPCTDSVARSSRASGTPRGPGPAHLSWFPLPRCRAGLAGIVICLRGGCVRSGRAGQVAKRIVTTNVLGWYQVGCTRYVFLGMRDYMIHVACHRISNPSRSDGNRICIHHVSSRRTNLVYRNIDSYSYLLYITM